MTHTGWAKKVTPSFFNYVNLIPHKLQSINVYRLNNFNICY